MAGFLGGKFALAKYLHPFTTKDGDEIGPGSYTLHDGAAIFTIGPFKPLGVIRTQSLRDRMTADAALSGLDISDTSKSLVQFFWTPPAPLLSTENTFFVWANSGHTDHKLRMGRDTGTGGFYARYHRSADLNPGNPTIEIKASEVDIVDINAFYSNILYMNANSIAEGKWFVDGVDRTTSVSATSTASVPATGREHLVIGNHSENFNHHAGILDHITIIQDPELNNTKAAALATQYHDTRGLGFRPAFLSVDKNLVEIGTAITLTGTGFGGDVVVSIDGVPVDSQVRVSLGNIHDSKITFNIPNVATGIKNIKIENIEAGVFFEETAAITVIPNLIYSGAFADLIWYHLLESETSDVVGPTDYDTSGNFTTTGAKFGKGFQAETSSHFFASNVGIPGYDGSDGAKTIFHMNWTPTGAGGEQSLMNFINSGFTGSALFLDYNAGGADKLKFVRNRAVNLPSGKNEITIKSNLVDTIPASLLSIAAYMDGGSISQGKIFVNGVDETDTVTEDLVAVSPRGDFILMGTDISTFSKNANTIDEIAVIQDTTVTDSKMANLVTNYDDTRAFGYRPICINLSVLSGPAGTSVSLIGQGFGKDVQIFLNGTPVDSLVRVNEGLVTFVVPVMPPGLVDVKIDNVTSNVQVTVQNGFEVTLFTVLTASATERRKFTITFDQDIKQVDPANSDDSLNPANYTLRPVNTPQFTAAFTPIVLSVSIIDSDTIELLVDDDFSYALDYEVTVLNVQSVVGGGLDPTNRDFVFTAVDPRPEHRI